MLCTAINAMDDQKCYGRHKCYGQPKILWTAIQCHNAIQCYGLAFGDILYIYIYITYMHGVRSKNDILQNPSEEPSFSAEKRERDYVHPELSVWLCDVQLYTLLVSVFLLNVLGFL